MGHLSFSLFTLFHQSVMFSDKAVYSFDYVHLMERLESTMVVGRTMLERFRISARIPLGIKEGGDSSRSCAFLKLFLIPNHPLEYQIYIRDLATCLVQSNKYRIAIPPSTWSEFCLARAISLRFHKFAPHL